MNRKGLNLFPSSQIDAQLIKEKLNDAGFTFEWDVKLGCFFFEEEEACYDALENAIGYELNGSNVNYRIEGIF